MDIVNGARGFWKKWKIALMFAPVYIIVGMIGYWSILDRADPVQIHHVDYNPTNFLETQDNKNLFITYTLTRLRKCSASTDRYIVSISDPSDIHFIESIPNRLLDDKIGEQIKVHFEVKLPDNLPPGDYNYYAISSYSCVGNPIQSLYPLRIQTPYLPVHIFEEQNISK